MAPFYVLCKPVKQVVKTTTCFHRTAVLSPQRSEISLFLNVLKKKSSRFSQTAAEKAPIWRPGRCLLQRSQRSREGGRAGRGVNGHRKGHGVEAGQILGTPFAVIVSTLQRAGARGNNRHRKAHVLLLFMPGLCTNRTQK